MISGRPLSASWRPAQQAAFMGMVANFDWNLGRLREYLQQQRLESETIIIFLTDNGTSAGTIFGEGGRITGFLLIPAKMVIVVAGKAPLMTVGTVSVVHSTF